MHLGKVPVRLPSSLLLRIPSKALCKAQGGGTHAKGAGQAKGKSDAAPSTEDDVKIDMKALPAAVRRQLSRPRWRTDFLKGCCTEILCPLPHHSENSSCRDKGKGSCVQGCWCVEIGFKE